MTSSVRARLAPFATLTIVTLLAMLFKSHCMHAGGWTNYVQYTTGCYSDAVPFWSGRGVAYGDIPYFQARLEYPVLTGLLIWSDGAITRLLFGADANATQFVWIVTIVNGLLAMAVLEALVRSGIERARIWAWCLAPPLMLYLGHNWDMLAICLSTLGLLAARKTRWIDAGALLGLAAAAKLFPAVLVPVIAFAALIHRPGRQDIGLRVLDASAVVLAAGVAWGIVDVPVMVGAWTNWSEFYVFSNARSGTAAATWDVLDHLGLLHTDIPLRNRLATAVFVIGACAIMLGGGLRHRHACWILALPVLAWFMITNKVWSPQFDLWLWPVALIALPRLRPLALFAVGDLASYFTEFWMFAGMAGAHPSATQDQVAIAAGIRMAAMVWMMAETIVRPARPWTDPDETEALAIVTE